MSASAGLGARTTPGGAMKTAVASSIIVDVAKPGDGEVVGSPAGAPYCPEPRDPRWA